MLPENLETCFRWGHHHRNVWCSNPWCPSNVFSKKLYSPTERQLLAAFYTVALEEDIEPCWAVTISEEWLHKLRSVT